MSLSNVWRGDPVNRKSPATVLTAYNNIGHRIFICNSMCVFLFSREGPWLVNKKYSIDKKLVPDFGTGPRALVPGFIPEIGVNFTPSNSHKMISNETRESQFLTLNRSTFFFSDRKDFRQLSPVEQNIWAEFYAGQKAPKTFTRARVQLVSR